MFNLFSQSTKLSGPESAWLPGEGRTSHALNVERKSVERDGSRLICVTKKHHRTANGPVFRTFPFVSGVLRAYVRFKCSGNPAVG